MILVNFYLFFLWSVAVQKWAVTPWICVLWPWNLFFWKELWISDFLTTYLMVIRRKTEILETLQKQFFIKNSKNSYFLWLQILHWFSKVFKKFKNSFFQDGSNLHMFLNFYWKSIIESALESPSSRLCEYLRNIIPSSMSS